MASWINEFGGGISAHLLYFVISIVLIAVFVALYTAITPYREIALIRAGNPAAAVSLAGALLGFALPLAQAVAQSGDLDDMLTWSAVALAAQLAAYGVTRLLLPQLPLDVKEGKLAPAIFLAALSIATGVLNAAAMAE